MNYDLYQKHQLNVLNILLKGSKIQNMAIYMLDNIFSGFLMLNCCNFQVFYVEIDKHFP